MVTAQPLLDLNNQVADISYLTYQPYPPQYDPYLLQEQQQKIKPESVDSQFELGRRVLQSGLMATANGGDVIAQAEAAIAAANKPKRVRTGCLTCRERHLKCDEGQPTCLNCRKSARECRRGVRLNFIDTQCKQPPIIAHGDYHEMRFEDESRQIASEYVDGIEQYARRRDSELPQNLADAMGFSYQTSQPTAQMMSHQQMPNIQVMTNGHTMQQPSVNLFDQPHERTPSHQPPPGAQSVDSTFSHASLPSHHSNHASQHPSPYDQHIPNSAQTEPEYHAEAKEILNTQEETLYMQVFVEEVGLWMDSMDAMKHVRVSQSLSCHFLLTFLSSPASYRSMHSASLCC